MANICFGNIFMANICFGNIFMTNICFAAGSIFNLTDQLHQVVCTSSTNPFVLNLKMTILSTPKSYLIYNTVYTVYCLCIVR